MNSGIIPGSESEAAPAPSERLAGRAGTRSRDTPRDRVLAEGRSGADRGCSYNGTVIEFHLDQRSGVATYLQIVHQVQEALRLGVLDVGDQLPTVREVVADLAINPNTVAKAYRELEREGLVVAQQGRGTFVASTLAAPSIEHAHALRRELERWLADAERAGLDEESVRALISTTLREAFARRAA